MNPITLPWPSKDLSPNARVHWSKRAKAASESRELGRITALSAGWNKLDIPRGIRIHLFIDFYPPTRRMPDDDNMLSRFKAYRDGIADAMGINDKRFISHPYVHEEVRKNGEVVVAFSLHFLNRALSNVY